MFKICKKCNQSRQLKYIGTVRGVAQSIDESGRKWVGRVCGTCTMPTKRSSNKLQVGDCKDKKCIKCGEIKKLKIVKFNKSCPDWRDEQNQVFQGQCYSCLKKSRLKPRTAHCKYCTKPLSGGPSTKIYCNPNCRLRFKRGLYHIYNHSSWSPPKIKEIDYTTKEHCLWWPQRPCKHCGVLFSPPSANSWYCKHNHKPSSIKARKRRKKHERYIQPISMYYLFELADIYCKRPKSMEVDHIIPRNHPDVCGLHVPWNLQYLTPEENRKKSNSIKELGLNTPF